MKEKFRITKNSITLAGGLCFILLALVTLLSNNTPFAFLAKIVTTVFGFVGFWVLIPFILVIGFYLIFKKKMVKLKFGLTLWGLFIIIVCFIILSSYWASVNFEYNGMVLVGSGRDKNGAAKYLIFSNAIDVFEAISKDATAFDPRLGGGYVGFIVAGALNSALTPIGLNIICWFFFLGGLAMILNREVKKLVKYIRTRKGKASKEEDDEYKEINLESDENDDISPKIGEKEENNENIFQAPEAQPKPAIRAVYETFHTSTPINNDYSLKKAHFAISDEPVIEDSMVKKLDDVEPQNVPNENSFVKETVGEEMSESTLGSEEKNAAIEEPIFEEAPQVEETHEQAIEEPVEEVDFLHKPQPKANPIRDYIYPTLDLLDLHDGGDDNGANEALCEERTNIINETLANLNVGGKVVSHTVGPSVTRFDLQMNSDVSVNTVQKYINDISIRLNGVLVRFEQIVAGKSTSGLEIPNAVRTNVGLRESVAALPVGEKYLLNIPFGKDISGDLKYANLADFPHMLVSGTTGSGKSIFIHSTILTLILRNRPDQIKLLLIDPKKVEMTYYDNIPHLLCPTISDVKKVYAAFMKLVDEMERRYNLFQANRVRDIKGFNEFAKQNGLQPLPHIIVFVDEYADLVDTCKEVKEPVVRVMQKARAAGISMVIATQRPSVNVIDGVIKANIPTRVALMSANAVDSTTIIGEGGAEKLLGYGDMLIDCSLISRSDKPRVQGCYVSDAEINRVCDFLRDHYQPSFDENFMNLDTKVEDKHSSYNEPAIEEIDKSKNEDDQYEDIKEQVMHREYCSISFIQRSFSMGFSRAGKIFHRLVMEGVVAEKGDAKGCKVLMYVPIEQTQQGGTIEQSTFIPDENNED